MTARDSEEIAEGHHLTARSERIADELVDIGRRCHTHRAARPGEEGDLRGEHLTDARTVQR